MSSTLMELQVVDHDRIGPQCCLKLKPLREIVLLMLLRVEIETLGIHLFLVDATES